MNLDEFLQESGKKPEIQRAEEKLKARLDLADAVIRARIQKGWSQSELAEKIGTKQASISRIESALANPTLSMIQKLCSVLDLSIQFKTSTEKAIEANPQINPIQTEAYKIESRTIEDMDWSERPCSARWDSRSSSSSGEERLEA